MIVTGQVFGALAALGSVASYVPYLRDVWKGKTKPHAFTWFVWAVLNVVVFFVQVGEGAGPGALVTAVIALANTYIAWLAFKHSPGFSYRLSDWLALGAALVALVVWRLAHQPLVAIIFLTLTDVFGFIPTWRKGWWQPYQETTAAWFLSGLSLGISLLALEAFTPTTALYPAAVTLLDTGFAVTLLLRRRIVITTH